MNNLPAAGTQKSNFAVPLLLMLAFVLVAVWLVFQQQQQAGQDYPPYSSISPAPDGCMALYDLLAGLGAKPKRFTETEYRYPKGACMIALQGGDEFSYMFSGGLDVKALRLWLEDGGILLLGAGSQFDRSLSELLTELDPDADITKALACERRLLAARERDGSPGEMAAMSSVYKPGSIYRLKENRPELFRDVKYIETATSAVPYNLPCDVMLGAYDPGNPGQAFDPVMLYRKCGKGELIIFGCPEMLSNSWIGRADNHRLILNVISYASQGRELYFDEHLHGYQGGSPNALALLFQTTGGRLLLALTALVSLLWAGQAIRPARFGPTPVPPRRQATEMVLAQADLFRRANARHSVADALVDTLRRVQMEALHTSTLPSSEELAAWVRGLRGSLDQRQQKAVEALLQYLETRALPRSGSELAALAGACDLLRTRLNSGQG